jgi:hypothetical protein
LCLSKEPVGDGVIIVQAAVSASKNRNLRMPSGPTKNRNAELAENAEFFTPNEFSAASAFQL